MGLLKILFIPIACLLYSASAHSDAVKPVRFVVPSFKPYTYQEDYDIKGLGVSLVTRAMDNLNHPYTLKLVPNYGRALTDLSKGSADGFFLASENAERNAVAVFSKPLMTNRWSWFFIRQSPISTKRPNFKTNTKIGTFLHANTHKWLIKHDYQRIKPVTKVELLPEMLIYGRIQSVFLAEVVFHDAVTKAGFDISQFRRQEEVAKPFGIYISRGFLKDHPGFMERLNTEIDIITAKTGVSP